MKSYNGQYLIECDYCGGFRHYVTIPGKSLGRCKCGGKRGLIGYQYYEDADAPKTDPDVVTCYSCGLVSEPLTERVKAERARIANVHEWLDAHRQEQHRGRIITDRLAELARDVRREGPAIDWKHSELAIEYRALMREWWTLPSAQVQHIYMTAADPLPGVKDYLRPLTTAANAVEAVERNTVRHDGAAALPELARKAVHAVRKIRPDLFEGYKGSTQYSGPDWTEQCRQI